MSDLQNRSLERARQADPADVSQRARLYRERLRAGAISRDHLDAAANARDPAARPFVDALRPRAQCGDAEVERLVELDGQVPFTRLDLSGWSLSDGGLSELGACSALTRLDLCACPEITGVGLAGVAASPSLRELALRDAPRFSGAHLRHLHGMTSLSVLDLAGLDLVDADLHVLASLSWLRCLRLDRNPKLTSRGAERLVRARWLRSLSLRDTHVTDDWGEHLGVLPALSRLDLSHNPHVTDAFFAEPFRSADLARLLLCGVSLTRRGLGALRELSLIELDLDRVGVDDAWAEDLLALPCLEALHLERNGGWTEEGLWVLAQSPRWKVLSLAQTSVTELGDLRGCPSLRSLGVRGNALKPRAPAQIARLESLRDLDVSFVGWGTRDVERLGALQRLETLRLCGNRVDWEALRALSRCAGLGLLDLSGCEGVSDAALEELRPLHTLRTLGLSGCERVGDAGLVELEALSGLRFVELARTRVSQEGARWFHRLLAQRD